MVVDPKGIEPSMYACQSRAGLSIFYLVDPKGIEPSNLTDANRALSQVGMYPREPSGRWIDTPSFRVQWKIRTFRYDFKLFNKQEFRFYLLVVL